MRESIKMDELDGYLKRFIKTERTKILPLRWFANLCETPAAYHLSMALHHIDHDDHGIKFKCHAILSNLFYWPYYRWGTFYRLKDDKSL